MLEQILTDLYEVVVVEVERILSDSSHVGVPRIPRSIDMGDIGSSPCSNLIARLAYGERYIPSIEDDIDWEHFVNVGWRLLNEFIISGNKNIFSQDNIRIEMHKGDNMIDYDGPNELNIKMVQAFLKYIKILIEGFKKTQISETLNILAQHVNQIHEIKV